MSIAPSPPRPRHNSRLTAPDFAAICRARHIVERLGGRFSLELGIDLDREPEEVERWALAVTLLGDDNLWSVAMCTYRVLERAGIRTLDDAGRCDRDALVTILDEGGYLRYEGRMASRLLALAELVADRYGGRMAAVGEQVVDRGQLSRTLGTLPGWSPAIARAFLRELGGVWAGAGGPLDRYAALAARHVALPPGADALRSLAAAAHLDFRDLEAGLVRLALCHDLASCPGEEECPFAAFASEQFVHF